MGHTSVMTGPVFCWPGPLSVCLAKAKQKKTDHTLDHWIILVKHANIHENMQICV